MASRSLLMAGWSEQSDATTCLAGQPFLPVQDCGSYGCDAVLPVTEHTDAKVRRFLQVRHLFEVLSVISLKLTASGGDLAARTPD